MARNRRFTDTSSEEENHSRASSPPGSVQTPCSNQEPTECAITKTDSSDTKSVDSGGETSAFCTIFLFVYCLLFDQMESFSNVLLFFLLSFSRAQ